MISSQGEPPRGSRTGRDHDERPADRSEEVVAEEDSGTGGFLLAEGEQGSTFASGGLVVRAAVLGAREVPHVVSAQARTMDNLDGTLSIRLVATSNVVDLRLTRDLEQRIEDHVSKKLVEILGIDVDLDVLVIFESRPDVDFLAEIGHQPESRIVGSDSTAGVRNVACEREEARAVVRGVAIALVVAAGFWAAAAGATWAVARAVGAVLG